MKVFFSRSEPASLAVAKALASWLSLGTNAVDPFISKNIDKGASGLEEIASELEESRVGVVCLTRENQTEPWVLFEAGALSKTRERVWTFLLDLTFADVKPPLARFQHTAATKEDVRTLLTSVNNKVQELGELARTEEQLHAFFDMSWPDLEQKLLAARRLLSAKATSPRPEREILEELLGLVRKLNVARDDAESATATQQPPGFRYGFSDDGLLHVFGTARDCGQLMLFLQREQLAFSLGSERVDNELHGSVRAQADEDYERFTRALSRVGVSRISADRMRTRYMSSWRGLPLRSMDGMSNLEQTKAKPFPAGDASTPALD